ncbi:hypothetical protein K2173_008133 [Erythroxylum novogranatense]|uniref:Serine-threonine/tyrosine-protein kinase catalytic domain-containing protein n=1 Tax=Erythroxylum novogranatense TaxID=1862640 RepID=A0AAV8S9G5_9ROSI|nr:hypothetical protein K2173_008133 [Erythroxylum novogranatense]
MTRTKLLTLESHTLLKALPEISLDELKEFTDKFGTNALIGEGSSERVYSGVLKSGHASSIKKLDAIKQPNDEFIAQISRASRLKHHNFAHLLGYCVDGGSRVLAYEFASNGSLHDIFNGTPRMQILNTSVYYFLYVVGRFAITGQLNAKSDCYGFGVVLLELLTGRKPVDHTLPRGYWTRQCVDVRLQGEYPPKAVAKIATLAALCLQYDADLWPNISVVVKALQPLLNLWLGLASEKLIS